MTWDEYVYIAPETLEDPNLDAALQPVSRSEISNEEDCVICFESLGGHAKVVSLKTCSHKYHLNCIQRALLHKKSCPVCQKLVCEPRGRSPSGTMQIRKKPSVACAGYDQGTIVIQYNLPGGTQREFHQNPGQQYSGTHRTAYVPDVPEGRDTVARLQYAFQRGLTFAVGTSLTTHCSNTVVWTSVHHKTSLSGGAYGYPDEDYLRRCNEELDHLGVPAAHRLPSSNSPSSKKRKRFG